MAISSPQDLSSDFEELMRSYSLYSNESTDKFIEIHHSSGLVYIYKFTFKTYRSGYYSCAIALETKKNNNVNLTQKFGSMFLIDNIFSFERANGYNLFHDSEENMRKYINNLKLSFEIY